MTILEESLPPGPLDWHFFRGKTLGVLALTGESGESSPAQLIRARAEQFGAMFEPDAKAAKEILIIPDLRPQYESLRSDGCTLITRDQFQQISADAEAQYARAIGAFMKPSFAPVVAALGDEQLDPQGHRYFGSPWLPDNMAWPEHENKPLIFVLQLRVANLPEPTREVLGGKGLLLFFYAGELGSHYGDEHTLPGEQFPSVVCLVDERLAGTVRKSPGNIEQESALQIVDWIALRDHPTETEFAEGELDLDPAMDRLWSESVQAVDLFENPNCPGANHSNFHGDKLGGWESWTQGINRPKDRNGKQMEFIYQVGFEGLFSPDAARVDYPTWGVGQIHFSTQTGEFYYSWACG
jgi:uncharacterized protein YwqG